MVRGPDKDSYYHGKLRSTILRRYYLQASTSSDTQRLLKLCPILAELFLRGRPDLHIRMKRLSADHRKTPQNKEDKCPDFVELSKTSPLPHIHLVSRGKIKGRAAKSGGVKKAENNDEEKPVGSPKKKSPSSTSGVGSMKIVEGTFDEDGLPKTVQPSGSPYVKRSPGLASILGKRSAQSMEEEDNSDTSSERPSPVSSGTPNMKSIIALQRDNDDLRRRIVAMEMNQTGPMTGPMAGHRYRPRGPPPNMYPGLIGRPRGHPQAVMSGDVDHRLSEISRFETELMMMRSGSAMPPAGMAMGQPGMYAGPSAGEYRHPMDHQMMARAMHQGRMGGRHRVPPPAPGSYHQGSSGDLRWNSSMDQQLMGRSMHQGRTGGRHHIPPPVVD